MITNIPPSPPQYDEFGRLIMSPQQIMPATVQAPAQAPIPIQQQSTPNFNPIPHLQMAPATPAQEQNIPLPTPDQFHNSRLRTVLNAIAGGFAGAAAGPKIGFEVGQNLSQAPYNRAMQTYDTKVADQKRRLGIEGERMKRSEFESSEGVKVGTAQSQADKRVADVATAEDKAKLARDAQNTKDREQASKDTMRKAAARLMQAKMDNPKLTDFQHIEGLEDPEEKKAAVELYNEMHPKESYEEKVKVAGGIRAAQLVEEAKQRPAIAGATATAVDTAHANAPVSETDQAALDVHIKRAKDNPDAINDIAKQVPKKLQSRYWTALATTNIPIPISSKLQETATGAKTAILHADKIRELLKDPDIAKAIGPIAGRITEGGQAIGKSVYNTGPAAEKEQEFLTMMSYLVPFEATSISGTRPSWQLIQYLKKVGPQSKMDMSKIQGALDAVKESAGIRLGGIYGKKPTDGKPKLEVNWH